LTIFLKSFRWDVVEIFWWPFLKLLSVMAPTARRIRSIAGRTSRRVMMTGRVMAPPKL
jgi:hypothetical protein